MNKVIGFCLRGDKYSGYWTELTYGGKAFARHNDYGELDLLLENGDRSDRMRITSWRASEAYEEDGRLILKGKLRLSLFTTDLNITVTYEKITDNVIKKTVRLYQNDIPRLFVSIRNSLEPVIPPKAYWSFDHLNHDGGPAYGTLADDVYPAAGFVDENGLVVGLLTDSGWNNKWCRFSWRRTCCGNTSAVRLVDPALLATATSKERAEGKHYVALTLGEAYSSIRIPFESKDEAKGRYTFLGRRGYRYTIAMEYRGRGTHYVSLYDLHGNKIGNIAGESAYLNALDSWTSFVGYFMELPDNGLYIIRVEGVDEAENFVELRNVRIFESSPDTIPWHELYQGKEIVRTAFIFADEMEFTIRNIRLKSQLYLADGLGFKGSDIEKVVYADAKMLTWVTEPGVDEPVVVPSIYYFEMYFRDAFWTLNGIWDAFLNENILRRIGNTMDERGCVDNIITAYHGSIEHSDNEITYLYIIWSYLNKKRFGIEPDMERVRKATSFIISSYDPDGDGVIYTNNPQSGIDVMWQDRLCRFASSQGYYAVALRAAKELGVEIEEEYIRSAELAYRSYYGDYGVYGKFLHTFPDNKLGKNGSAVGIIANVDFEPEFLSIYMFGRPMLDCEIVINTLEKYPLTDEGLMPNLCMTDGTFFTKESNPFNGGLFWQGGTYVNGGSWLRQQYIALAVGKYHGWSKADEIMRKRLNAELNFDFDNPVSREYLSLTGDPKDSALHRVFGWNAFILAINEWLGLREPQWDPDYSKEG